jgi:flagellar motor switch/type III secretory pathway protein FliN
MPPEVTALSYPWGSLDRLSRSTARNWGALKRQLDSAGLAEKLASALAAWVGEPVRVERHRMRPMPAEPEGPSTRLRFRLAGGTGEVVACFESRLITRMIGFALNREVKLGDPLMSVDPALRGATAAILAKIIEDARIGFELEFSSSPAEIPDAQRVQFDLTLHIGSMAYPLVLGVILSWLRLREPTRAPNLLELGTLELELPIVVGESLIHRDELALLGPGMAFLTGTGLWIDEAQIGRAALVAPHSERGIEVQLRPDRKIVLGERAVTINHDSPKPAATSTETLVDTLFEAPVVVRVEMGTVSLPAKDWAHLRPGDILETGQPLGADVTLRVAGKVVAKGELLNVEGELGVRITKLLVGDEA